MRKVNFHEDATAEMIDAARYYEERAAGLGLSFLASVDEALAQISQNPDAWQPVGDELRRKLLRRFPYSILYAIESDRIRVMAVAHQKRRPGYWRHRLPNSPMSSE